MNLQVGLEGILMVMEVAGTVFPTPQTTNPLQVLLCSPVSLDRKFSFRATSSVLDANGLLPPPPQTTKISASAQG